MGLRLGRWLIALAITGLLAGCGQTSVQRGVGVVAQGTATTAAVGNLLAGIPTGKTAEGYHTLGASNAPVTLVMYSDFL